jgi:lipid-binding SYLF domain-containing protein
MLGLMLSSLASAVMAIEPSELDNRIRTLTDKFEAFQHQSGKSIPAETLRQAQGIILLDTTKGGLVFGYQAGNGVAMVKDAKLGQWSPAAFVKANQASFGAQIGEEQNFYIILLMTTNSTWRLIDPKIEFGAGAGGTANASSGGVQTKTPSDQDVVVYKDHVGLYGGAVVKGGNISSDGGANRVYYGQDLSMRDILFDHKAQPSTITSKLAEKIDSYTHDSAGSKSVKN